MCQWFGLENIKGQDKKSLSTQAGEGISLTPNCLKWRVQLPLSAENYCSRDHGILLFTGTYLHRVKCVLDPYPHRCDSL